MSALLKSLKQAAFLEGNFVTRSGKPTTYYIDKYLFETKPEILDPLCDALAALFPPSDTYDLIAAPELGAVSLAALLSVKLKKPFVIVRKSDKGYGTKRLIEGEFKAGDRVAVIEDILTTGGAVMQACDVLKSENIRITRIVGVINREEGAFENLASAGYDDVKALFTTTDLKTCQ
jgi:orotate phosphoribosyltransferase